MNFIAAFSFSSHNSSYTALQNAVRASTGPIVTFPATATPFVTRCPATARVRAMPDGPRCFLGGPVQKVFTSGFLVNRSFSRVTNTRHFNCQ